MTLNKNLFQFIKLFFPFLFFYIIVFLIYGYITSSYIDFSYFFLKGTLLKTDFHFSFYLFSIFYFSIFLTILFTQYMLKIGKFKLGVATFFRIIIFSNAITLIINYYFVYRPSNIHEASYYDGMFLALPLYFFSAIIVSFIILIYSSTWIFNKNHKKAQTTRYRLIDFICVNFYKITITLIIVAILLIPILIFDYKDKGKTLSLMIAPNTISVVLDAIKNGEHPDCINTDSASDCENWFNAIKESDIQKCTFSNLKTIYKSDYDKIICDLQVVTSLNETENCKRFISDDFEIYGNNLPISFYIDCIYSIAVNTKNYSACDSLEGLSVDYLKKCYKDTNISSDNYRSCEFESDKNLIGLGRGVCSGLTHKYKCYIDQAVANRDISICIYKMGLNSLDECCYEKIMPYLTEEMCDKYYEDKEVVLANQCYHYLAIYTKDAKHCQNITNFGKESCINELNFRN